MSRMSSDRNRPARNKPYIHFILEFFPQSLFVHHFQSTVELSVLMSKNTTNTMRYIMKQSVDTHIIKKSKMQDYVKRKAEVTSLRARRLLKSPPTDWYICYTSLKLCQRISANSTTDQKTVVTLDLQLYIQSMQLYSKHWRRTFCLYLRGTTCGYLPCREQCCPPPYF